MSAQPLLSARCPLLVATMILLHFLCFILLHRPNTCNVIRGVLADFEAQNSKDQTKEE